MAPDNNNPNEDTRDGLEKAADRVSNIFSKLTKQIGQGATMPADASAFLRAVKMGKVDEVKKVIAENKISLDTRNGSGDTALHICAKNNRHEIAALLLDAGANPRLARDEDDAGTPLDDAVNFGRIEMVELLTRHGAYRPGDTREGRTLLHRACEKGKPGMVEAFIRAGADANEMTENGTTPLLIALSYRQSEVAAALLSFPEVAQGINKYFTKTDPQQRSAFQIAVDRGQVEAVRLMIPMGGDVNTPDAEGNTPLMSAIRLGNAEMVKLLAQAGASLNKSGNGAPLPLSLACSTREIASEETRAQIVSILVACGADTDPATGAIARTPLHDALKAQNGEGAVKALLDAGANPDAREMTEGRTPLIEAILQNDAASAALLLGAGANPKLTDVHGKSALSYARAALQRDGDENAAMKTLIAALQAVLDARADWPKPSLSDDFNKAAKTVAQDTPAPAGAKPQPQAGKNAGKKGDKKGPKNGQSWNL